MVRSAEEWRSHPQGRELARRPVVEVLRIGDSPPEPPAPAARPPAGVRVLDLTRVLAGPTFGRTPAAHGAAGLRTAPPHLPHLPHLSSSTAPQ